MQERLERAIDEFEEKDESQWTNIKALRGPEWKGRLRKRVGPPNYFQEGPRPRGRGNFGHSHQGERQLPLINGCSLLIKSSALRLKHCFPNLLISFRIVDSSSP
jgi:hypothetical protein